MTDVLLRHLEITNFRSIKGTVQAPLDAKVVVVHGENGAGKTSLLSAIELALTGRVISLQRADPQYMSQLLHRSPVQDAANQGIISLQTEGLTGENNFQAVITQAGVQPQAPASAPIRNSPSGDSQVSAWPPSLAVQLIPWSSLVTMAPTTWLPEGFSHAAKVFD
jgi:exonuclease SbcC